MSANGHFFAAEIETFWSGAPFETLEMSIILVTVKKDTEKN